jgi:hypothetical protein
MMVIYLRGGAPNDLKTGLAYALQSSASRYPFATFILVGKMNSTVIIGGSYSHG